MTLPHAVLLDLDNTVYAYQPCHMAGLQAAQQAAAPVHDDWRTETGFAADYARARQAVKARLGVRAASHSRLLYFKQMIEAKFGRTAIGTCLQLREAYWQGYSSQLILEAGCRELLRDLRASGVRLACVSNYTTERQMWKLRALGLLDAVEYLITSEEAGAEKPDPAPFDLALSRLAARPAETWMVGDDLYDDVCAAKARGLTSVWLQRDESIAGNGCADHVVRNWFALRELFGLA